jgi:hypothetical protein
LNVDLVSNVGKDSGMGAISRTEEIVLASPLRASMTTEELDARRVRAAKSQSLLREVNERIADLAVLPTAVVNGAKPAPMFEEVRLAKEIDLACECIDEACTQRVTMTVREYEAVRSDSNTFFVKPGHDVPEVEEVVREEANYVVVSKVGAGTHVAQKLDPRKRRRP